MATKSVGALEPACSGRYDGTMGRARGRAGAGVEQKLIGNSGSGGVLGSRGIA